MPQEKLYLNRNLQIVFGVTLMAVLAVASISPAFPRVMEQFQLSKPQVGWLISAVTLPSAIFAPFVGFIGDKWGRKRMVVPALFLFGLAGGACAFAPNYDVLLALRFLQGIGMAILGALYATLVGDVCPGKDRVRAMGLNGGMLSAGNTVYPLIGGWLAGFGWNYPFLLPLVAIPIGFLAMKYLNYTEPLNRESFKSYIGGSWGYLKQLRILAVFLAAIIAFILSHGAFYAYISLYAGEHFNAPPGQIGLFASMFGLVATIAGWQLGNVAQKLKLSLLIKIGLAVMGVAMLAVPFMPGLWFLFIPVAVFGFAHGTVFPTLQSYIITAVPAEYRAVMNSFNSSMFRLGQTLGPIVIGWVFVIFDYKGAFLAAGILGLATGAVGLAAGRLAKPAKVVEA